MRKRSEYKGGDNRRKPSKERRVTVGESNTLLPFLFELLKEQSRSSVKGLLSRGQISVNGKVTRQFDAPLNPNDTVGINYGRGKVEFNNPLLRIVWEDDDLIVINKREGLLSVSTDRIKERTAYRTERLRERMRPSQQDIRLAPSGPRHIGYHDVRQEPEGKRATTVQLERGYHATDLRGRDRGTTGERHGFDRIQPRGEQAYASVRDTRW